MGTGYGLEWYVAPPEATHERRNREIPVKLQLCDQRRGRKDCDHGCALAGAALTMLSCL